jgi:hypothetical protein
MVTSAKLEPEEALTILFKWVHLYYLIDTTRHARDLGDLIENGGERLFEIGVSATPSGIYREDVPSCINTIQWANAHDGTEEHAVASTAQSFWVAVINGKVSDSNVDSDATPLRAMAARLRQPR